MSLHLAATPGQIAPTVLLAGDPLRARYIAEKFLDTPQCYNEVRAAYGYTGTYQGKTISVQGTGMGMPSMALYTHELIQDYGVKHLIRVGSCGSLQASIQLRDIVLAQGACTDSNMNTRVFRGDSFAPLADFNLLQQVHTLAAQNELPVHVGNVLSADVFYDFLPEKWKLWASHGVLAVEMEAAALYTLAARNNVQALTVLTVSDSLVDKTAISKEEREIGFDRMIKLVLDAIS
ncbi:MAG: purine-nucleoside phosphorylase [Bacteroidota bacterium]